MMRPPAPPNGSSGKISLLVLRFCVLLGLCTTPLLTQDARAAEQGKSRHEILKQRFEEEAAREKIWRERYSKMAQAVGKARARLEEIEATRTWHNRGVTREQEEQTLASLHQAQQALESFFEEARREGVPPGWLR